MYGSRADVMSGLYVLILGDISSFPKHLCCLWDPPSVGTWLFLLFLVERGWTSFIPFHFRQRMFFEYQIWWSPPSNFQAEKSHPPHIYSSGHKYSADPWWIVSVISEQCMSLVEQWLEHYQNNSCVCNSVLPDINSEWMLMTIVGFTDFVNVDAKSHTFEWLHCMC